MQRISEKVGRYPDDRPLVGSALLIISGLFLLRLGVGFQADPEPLGIWIPPLLHSAVALSGGTIVLLRPARTEESWRRHPADHSPTPARNTNCTGVLDTSQYYRGPLLYRVEQRPDHRTGPGHAP